MRNFIFFTLLILLAFGVEGSFRYLPSPSIRIDLVWLMALYVAFFVAPFPGVVFIAVLSLAQESLGAPFHGAFLVSYFLIYFFVRIGHRHLSLEGGAAQAIWVILLTLAQRGVLLGLLLWGGYPTTLDLWRSLLSAVLQGLVSLALFPLLKNPGQRIRRLFWKERPKKVLVP